METFPQGEKRMKKLLSILTLTAVGGALALGFAQPKKADVVKTDAGTATTVYYAVPSDVVGTYTVKLNAKLQSDADNWNQGNMTKLSEQYGGYDLYSYSFTDLYDGVAKMQFQLYEGNDWRDQQEPIGSWTKAEKYNGKVYVHNDGWHTYTAGLDTYIPMRNSFFTDWTDAAGSIASVDARFWGENYSFEALAPFYRGETGESWTGTLTSRTWKQSTQYVYFQLGGARDYDHANGHAHLVFHYGTYSHDFYNNTFVENPMTLRYFKIPNEEFAAMTAEHDDFDMYVEVVDPASEGYGFVNLGYFHVNQTEESTSDAMRYFLNHMSTDSREWEINKRKQIMNTYFDNEDQRNVFFRTVSSIDDTFSSNSDFVNHWYFDHNYFNNNYNDTRHFDDAIGTDNYRPDANTNMPFNNDGGFFRGWYEGSVGAGFVASDGLRYRFVSRPFVLSGTGLISIKMSGKASLHVIDATVKNTDSQAADLAWIDNKGFHDSGSTSDMTADGFNTTAMVRHVINLEAYVGRKIQLAISDYDTSGWSAAYFDTLVCNYATRPGYRVEYATQTNNSGTFYPVFRDIYINSACKNDGNQFGVIYNGSNGVNTANDNAILNHVDSSDSLPAYNTWKSYLDAARGGNAGNNYCSALKTDGVKAALNSFSSLSNGAKNIVCASDDFERGAGGLPTIYGPSHQYNITQSLVYMAAENNINIGISNSSYLISNILNTESTPIVVVILIVSLVGLSLVALFAIKKRKHQ